MATRLKPELYDKLKQCLAGMFNYGGATTQPVTVAGGAGISIAKIDFSGSAYDIWDKILALAQEDNKIQSVVETGKKYKQHDFLDELLLSINKGEAYLLEEIIEKAKEGAQPERGRIRIFFNYDKNDELHKAQFEKYLRVYTNPDLNKNPLALDFFDMQKVDPGDGRVKKIKEELYSSDMVLLFMSTEFFSGEDGLCYSLTTMAHDLKKKLIPIIVGNAPYERIKIICDLQAIPYDEEPLENKAKSGLAMGKIYNELSKLIVKVVEKNLVKR